MPTNGGIAAGEGSITQSGSDLTVTQTSDRLIATWESFNIGSEASVRFAQPGADAVALNRVLGTDASRIQGRLSADGKVFLLNPNGVLFGESAQVDVGGIFASSLGISDEDFLAGRYTFSQSPDGRAGPVSNLGSLRTTPEGFVVLAAPSVNNAGSIFTPGGTTSLAAGSRVMIGVGDSGLLGVSVDGAALQAAARNSGTIQADGGQVAIQVRSGDLLGGLVLEADGLIQARSVQHREGRVFLDGGSVGNTLVTGTIDASGNTPGARGGAVTVLGQNVGLMAGSQVDASGAAGGGTVLIGGNWQGRGSERHADAVVMDAQSRITADATDAGNGGTVVLWSDRYTDFQGAISARGGAQQGHGGQVETSSLGNLQAFGSVDASAGLGRSGQWLLDPTNITISSAPTLSGSFNGSNPNLFTPSGIVTSNVNNATINSSLNAGTSVTITTASAGIGAGDINVNAPITKTAGGDATLTLRANQSIFLNLASPITSTAGRLGVVLNSRAADPALTGTGIGQVALYSNILTNGGDLTIYGGDAPGGYAYNAGAILTPAPAIWTALGVSLDARGTAGTGGNISLYGRANTARGIELLSGTQLLTQGTGGITLRGEVAQAGLGASGLFIDNNVTIGAQQGALNLSGQGYGGFAGLALGGAALSTTTGAINLTGTNPQSNSGIYKLLGANAAITSASGNVTLTGTVPGTGSSSGIHVDIGTLDITTGGGIALNGSGSGALTSTVLANGVLNLQAGTGIAVSGTGGSNGFGILNGGGGTFATTTGNISLNSDAAISNLGAMTASAGQIAASAGAGLTLGSLTSASASLTAGADLALNAFTKPATAVADSALDLRAAGNITVLGNVAAASGAGRLNTTLTSRYTDGAAGVITLGSVTTRGGDLLLGGGGVAGDGFAAGTLLNGGINLLPFSVLNAGGGNITLRARTSATSLVPALALPGTAQLLTSGAGQINLTGTNLIPSVHVYGMTLGDGIVLTTGAGNINVQGSTVSNLLGIGTGVGLAFAGGNFTTGSGHINFTGAGNNDAGLLRFISLAPTNFVSAGGNLSLTGTSNGTSIAGILIDSTSALNMTTSGAGAINWTGTGGSTVNNGVASSILIGSALNLFPTVNLSAGSGGLNITGNGASGATHGLFDYGNSSLFSSTGGLSITSNASLNLLGGLSSSGAINLVSSAGNLVTGALSSASNITLQAAGTLTSSGAITATAGGAIRLRAAGLNLGGLVSSTGALLIEPVSAAGSIGVGAAGSLQLASSLFSGGSRVFADGFSGITIGRADGSGALSLGAVTFTDPVTLLSPLAGGSLAVSGAVSNSAGGLTARVGGNVTLGAAGGITTAGAGGDIVLSTEGFGSFIDNSVSATPLVSAGGRWLVYTSTPANTVLGSTILASGNAAIWNGTHATLAPGSVAAGNRFIFNYSPTVTLSTANLGKVYGDNGAAGVLAALNASWDASLTAQAGWGTAFNALSVTDLLAGTTVTPVSAGADVTANVGVYPILFSSSPSSLPSGFTASYQTGGLLTITPRPLTISTLAGLTKQYGADDPLNLGAALSITGGNLVNGHLLTGTLGRVGGEGVGLYNFTRGSLSVGDGNGGNNYLLSFNGALNPFTITPAPLSVSFGNQLRVYGDVDPLLGSINPVLGGLVNRTVLDVNGNATVLNDTGQVAVSITGLTRAPGENVGAYAYTGVQLSTPVGSAAANYTAHATLAGTPVLTITPRPITISARADTRIYDGGVSSSLLPQLTGGNLVFGDTLNGLVQVFDQRNAGSRTLSVGGFVLVDGNGGGNYLVSTQTALGSITPRALTASVLVDHKVYDGTLGATGLFGPLLGVIGSDAVTLAGGATLSFADRNVGTGKVVTAAGLALSGGDAGNYLISAPLGLTANITPRAVAVVGLSAGDRVYDGTTTATLTGGALVGVLGADQAVLVQGTANFQDKNVGTGKIVDLANFTLSGLDALNYALTLPTGLTASITPASLSILGTVAGNRVYDGTVSASLNTSGSTLSGLFGGDDVTLLRASATGAFLDKNAATGKPVLVTGFTVNGLDAHNYLLTQPVGVTADITPRLLPVAGVTALDKVFDGTTTAVLNNTNAYLSGQILGDDLTLSTAGAVGTFATANAGTGIAVTASGYALLGLDAANYILLQPQGLAAYIAQAVLGVDNISVVGITANSREYDGTTLATLNTGGASLSGIVGGATNVSVVTTGAVGHFADKNVGVDKTVTITGFTLAGADASNYVLSATATTLASIFPRVLSIAGVVAANRIYDGTLAAQISGGTLSANVVAGEAVTLTGAGVGVFGDKNVGNGKTVSVTGFGLGGVDAGNYSLSQPLGVTASITPAMLSLTGVSANDRIYNGTLVAGLSGGTLSGVIGSDVVTVGGGVGLFDDKNVGTGKTVTVDGFVLAGLDGGNYLLQQPLGLTASITPATATVVGLSANDRVYNATTVATLSGTAALSGVVTGDLLTLSGTGIGRFADKNVGTDKSVVVDGLALVGADAQNYTLQIPTTLTADITRAPVSITGLVADDKVYDATTTALLFGGALSGVIGNDLVSFGGGAGAFADKNVGRHKPVSVNGFTLSGTDAGNYLLAQPTGISASITPATLLLSGVSAQSRVYNATTAATLAGGSLGGLLAGDVVNFSGGNAVFLDRNVGTGKTVLVNGFTLGGADAGNYIVDGPSVLSANITPAALTIGAVTDSRVYDGTTASGAGPLITGLQGADTATATQVFASRNVGNGIGLGVSGYTIADGNGGANYAVTLGGATGSITPRTLTAGGITADDKVYDALVAANVRAGGATLGNVVAEDVVSLGGTASGTFNDRNVGDDKPVAISGLTLVGADAGNYTLAAVTGVNADITRAPLTVTAVVDSRVFDGSTASTRAPVVTGLRGNDSATATQTFGSSGIGTGITLTPAVLINDGNGGANYQVSLVSSGGGAITTPPGQTAGDGTDDTYTPTGWRRTGGSPTNDGTPVPSDVDGTPPGDDEEGNGGVVVTIAPGVPAGTGGTPHGPIVVDGDEGGEGEVVTGVTYTNSHSDGSTSTARIAEINAETLRFVAPDRTFTSRLQFPVADGTSIIGRATVDVRAGEVTVNFVPATGTLPADTSASVRDIDTHMMASDGAAVDFQIDLTANELDITPENAVAERIMGPQRDLNLLKLVLGQAVVDAVSQMGVTTIPAVRLKR